MYAQKNIVKHSVFRGPIFTNYQGYQEKNRSEGLGITFESQVCHFKTTKCSISAELKNLNLLQDSQ